ncbi:hypothetical protein J6590_017074 [Homalodisca vitripennis]|nr:hypothetical protein J6590_017074 [Homalodisca vitripennis]
MGPTLKVASRNSFRQGPKLSEKTKSQSKSFISQSTTHVPLSQYQKSTRKAKHTTVPVPLIAAARQRYRSSDCSCKVSRSFFDIYTSSKNIRMERQATVPFLSYYWRSGARSFIHWNQQSGTWP